MKNKTLKTLLFTAIAVVSVVSTAYAETEGTGPEGQNFTFRGIPWNASKAEAEQMLEGEGAEEKWSSSDIYRLSGIDYANVTSGDDRVDEGGYNVSYSGLTVAGYTPSLTSACYMYQIGADGQIDRTEDTAQFYFGWYEFDSRDFSDVEAIYNDLMTKLTSLYGEGSIDQGESNPYLWTDTWTDNAGNQIRLLIGDMKEKERPYIMLGYISGDADARLDEVQAALDAEAAANEAAERESNKENVSGL